MIHPLYFVFLCFFSLFFPAISRAGDPASLEKWRMIDDLQVIKHHFDVGYAPIYWKREYAAWDLEQAFQEAKEDILSRPAVSTKQFQEILTKFCGSLKDYHVNISFYSKEKASLPFSVKEAEGRYFIDWVDPFYFPKNSRSLAKGDELLLFGEKPVAAVVQQLKDKLYRESNQDTDEGIALAKLTLRLGCLGDAVPQGPILIVTQAAATGKKRQHQFRWDYTPDFTVEKRILMSDEVSSQESVPGYVNHFTFDPKAASLSPLLGWVQEWTRKMGRSHRPFSFSFDKRAAPKSQGRISSSFHDFSAFLADREGSLGSRKSFLPPLGNVLWKYERKMDDEKKERDEEIALLEEPKPSSPVFWHAYIYEHERGYPVGYIRIPHYNLSLEETEELGKILSYMEKRTEALVIDQLHNFGGSLFSLYEVAAMLADSAMKTPLHRIKITQKEAMEAYDQLVWIEEIQKQLKLAEAKNSDSFFEEKEERGFSFIAQHLLSIKAFCQEILQFWQEGKTLTPLMCIEGVEFINPHPKYGYGKPLVMLIDEMDFSCADFMPAILQDNHRALLFGQRTAGAGGCVCVFEFPNSHGIASCSYTSSIAERLNGEKIENLGVVPDIYYKKTAQDLACGYEEYLREVNAAVDLQWQQNQQ